MSEQEIQLRENISRRTVIRGLAGLALAMGGFGCAVPGSSSMPVPTATSLPLGSVIYTYHGHSARVSAVAWSPDGRHIASGSLDRTVQVWDAITGDHTYIYRGHTDFVDAVAWSPDGRRIASGSFDKTVQVWDASTGEVLYTYRGHAGTVTAVAWSPDSKFIASGSFDKTVQVWDASTGEVLYTGSRHFYPTESPLRRQRSQGRG